jgi:hypothetical protein
VFRDEYLFKSGKELVLLILFFKSILYGSNEEPEADPEADPDLWSFF